MRSKTEVETFVLGIVDRLKVGQTIEDDLQVEIKAHAEPNNRTARRVAALANAARGNPAMLVLGVYEDRRSDPVRGTDVDMATWWAQLSSEFDAGEAPAHQVITLSIDDKSVVAIDMETDRAPYVVRVQGSNLLEVPYRSATSTRSARREDLVRILGPAVHRPRLEILGCRLQADSFDHDAGMSVVANVHWHSTLGDELVLRDADARAEVWHFDDAHASAREVTIDVPVWRSKDPGRLRLTSFRGEEQLIISGPGPGTIYAVFDASPEGLMTGSTAKFRVSCSVAGDDAEIHAEVALRREHAPDWRPPPDTTEPPRWYFGSH